MVGAYPLCRGVGTGLSCCMSRRIRPCSPPYRAAWVVDSSCPGCGPVGPACRSMEWSHVLAVWSGGWVPGAL